MLMGVPEGAMPGRLMEVMLISSWAGMPMVTSSIRM